MPVTRRALIAAASVALFARGQARAETVTDDAGRAVQPPAKARRVYPAGLPAAILLYTLAPDLLLGWPRSNRPQDCAYMLPDICARPEIGRLTGRGNTASLDGVAALKPDLILDVGSTGPRFAGDSRPRAAGNRRSLCAAQRRHPGALDQLRETRAPDRTRGGRRGFCRLLQHDALPSLPTASLSCRRRSGRGSIPRAGRAA